MKFDLFKYLFSLGFFYIYGRLILHYGLIFINYMLDQGMLWRAKFEKPRILFILVGLAFMHLMVYAYRSLPVENLLLQAITLVVFALAAFVTHLPWTEKFESTLQLHKRKPPQQELSHFNLKISEIQLQQLYNELVKYDLVQSDKTTFTNFERVLTQEWDAHNSRIHFNMDGPSCREFYDLLVSTFPTNTLTLKNFFQDSQLIIRPDGKIYKYNTIKNAPTRSSYSKKHSELKEIFQKMK